MLLGASPAMAVGLTKRAPAWMQRGGIEWIYRLAREPRRLAKRYLVDDLPLVLLLWQKWRMRLRRSSSGSVSR
jgi:N-acetylglucosaminyldiphosphoundecaprenol N-acetyl-beta-D-mannosaminyltransferase